MANYANLLATIAANIYTNGNNEVTAAMVKTAVDQMVASLGAGYQFKGVATPATDPGTPDQKVFYIATHPGVYDNFGGDLVEDEELALFVGSGSSWSKVTVSEGPVIRAALSFASRDILIASSITESDGYINSNGAIAGTAPFKHCDPIEIPAGVKYILFDYDNAGAATNYVNCYTNNDFTGFLGRSDNMAWTSLNHGPENYLIAMELPAGTRYISYLTSNNLQSPFVSLTPNIYGASEAEFGIIVGNSFIQNVGMAPKTPGAGLNIHFTIKANCNIADTESDTTNLQDSQELYDDYGVIMLPDNYSPSGKPTRLVIGCHGAGGDVDVNDSQTEQAVEYQYLVANGFAVMDMNGLPAAWATAHGVSVVNNIGSPIAMECYIKGYQFVLKHFNICPDGVLLSGGSMGGITASNLAMSGMMKVIAQGVNCPVLDAYNQIFLHPWSGGLPKTAMGIIYDLDMVGGQYVYDEDKICGYNPIVNGMQSFDSEGKRVTSVGAWDFSTHKLNGEDVVEYKDYPCPLKIWHSDDDNVVAPAVSWRQITAIRNAGGQAWLRRIPSGGHGPLTVGAVVTNPAGTNIYRGTLLRILPIVEEEFLFFSRFADVTAPDNGWTIISNAQTAMYGYYGPTGVLNTSIPEIQGIQKLEIPDGITKIRFATSADWTENMSIVCWDVNDVFLGVSGVSSPFGGAETIGAREFTLPTGTKYISYIYENSYMANDQHMGLAARILGQ